MARQRKSVFVDKPFVLFVPGRTVIIRPQHACAFRRHPDPACVVGIGEDPPDPALVSQTQRLDRRFAVSARNLEDALPCRHK